VVNRLGHAYKRHHGAYPVAERNLFLGLGSPLFSRGQGLSGVE
jgi:hypothetical protein